jgi:acetylornithine deacetylase/succinyl-diaminopimelate desuccinylase-like protein
MTVARASIDRAAGAVREDRLLDLATSLVAVPSPTGAAGPALDRLAEWLENEGFRVDRPTAGHPDAPAVVARLEGDRPGPCLQFDGHLDTVHLPFVPPSVEGGMLRGSGACDMKGGLAAAVEAMLALRDARAIRAGSILLSAHDLHEAPWGDGRQLDAMIRGGIVGDAVLLPEPLCGHLPVAGRGQACWAATVRRPGAPVHEVMRPAGEPSVIAAGAEIVRRLTELDESLAARSHPVAGRESVFIGQIHSGEIYNQYPQSLLLEGTRRWLPGADREAVEADLRARFADVASRTGTTIDLRYQVVRDAFALDVESPLVRAFQAARRALGDAPLDPGPKPFVDDGNSFWGLGAIAAITHGGRSGGQHTTEEWADVADLVRVARLYAATAVGFLGGGDEA